MVEENGQQNGTKRQRDPVTGRFVHGNGGGPGRPPGPTTIDFKAAIRGATALDDIREIWLKAIDQAKRGNDSARRFVFQTLGLIEILIDVTSAGEKIESVDNAAIAEAIAILGSSNGCKGCGE